MQRSWWTSKPDSFACSDKSAGISLTWSRPGVRACRSGGTTRRPAAINVGRLFCTLRTIYTRTTADARTQPCEIYLLAFALVRALSFTRNSLNMSAVRQPPSPSPSWYWWVAMLEVSADCTNVRCRTTTATPTSAAENCTKPFWERGEFKLTTWRKSQHKIDTARRVKITWVLSYIVAP